MMGRLSEQLYEWYKSNQRDLPWRNNPHPYYVWLSEVILQQTRISQGMEYFNRFVENFPNVDDLAQAEEDHVLKLWQGLGYYNRARNLHAAAQQVSTQHKGQFPADYSALLALKGVGPYTAAAIASIAFQLPYAVVDGNVIRVIARLYGIDEAVDKGSTLRTIQQLADEMLNTSHPGDHNQAMMELGAMVCSPKAPNCLACPLKTYCLAYAQGSIDRIPWKEKKIKRRTRYFHYMVVHQAQMTWIQQRGTDDIWANLFEFPMLETEDDCDLSETHLAQHLQSQTLHLRRINPHPKHVLSHQDLIARFYHLDATNVTIPNARLVSLDELHTFALPRLIDRYLEKYEPSEGKKRH